MTTETTSNKLRNNLASVLDKVVDDRKVVLVRRRNGKDVALIAADELAGLVTTVHLLGSAANARRLLSAVRARGKRMSIDQLRGEVGLGKSR
jgi:antitoxin YefM